MTTRKPYRPPQVVRVELNPDQAILSVCSVTAMTMKQGGGTSCRTPNNCKRGNGAGDSVARPS